MNRRERRKAAGIKRKVRALQGTLIEKHAQEVRAEMRAIFDNEWASRLDELYKKACDEEANRFAERLTELDRKASEHFSALVRWRRAYLATYLSWLADDGSPESQGKLTSMEAVEAAAHEFKDRLEIIESRVEKDAGYFDRPELLYGALRWLATTYRGAKTGGVRCPDLDESCRRSSRFWYTPHQSEVTMGQYPSDYEVTWRGKGVKLREHIGFGTDRDPRHTIRVAFFFDSKTKMVVVGYVGLHQQTRAT
jgi:hypothetical protein